MKKENLKIIGFKGFDKDFKCKDKQYSENQTFEETLTPEICSKEMHFCELPLNVFDYYAPDGKNQFAIVEAEGDMFMMMTNKSQRLTNCI